MFACVYVLVCAGICAYVIVFVLILLCTCVDRYGHACVCVSSPCRPEYFLNKHDHNVSAMTC